MYFVLERKRNIDQFSIILFFLSEDKPWQKKGSLGSEVLQFCPTSQTHASRWIENAKLCVCVCIVTYHDRLSPVECIPVLRSMSKDGLWLHRSPDQDKALTEDHNK